MDYYELLGVRRGASVVELNRAYKRLARQLHPALHPLDPRAAERFSAVTRAFEVLGDPDARARYDRGESEPEARGSEPAVEFHGFDFSVETRRTGAGFREIFDGLIPGDAPDRSPMHGEDLEERTELSFEESLRGARRRLQVTRLEACPICAGSGEASLSSVACPRCEGRGELRTSRGHMVFTKSCPDCGGRGTLSRPCSRCQGQGRSLQAELIEVEIPPGVANGSRVRVPRAGNAGRRGGSAGDFVLAIEVAPHDRFTREGDDLRCEVTVSFAEAAGGAHISVPTPDGPVTIEIPAGTQPGQRFRLRKRGMPRLGEKSRGDLWVAIRLLVPAVTEERGRALLEELERLQSVDAAPSGARRPAASKG